MPYTPAYALLGLADALQQFGHQYLGTARSCDVIDQAVQRALLEELWPFRAQTVSVSVDGVPAIGSLGPIKQVLAADGTVLAPVKLEDRLDIRSGSGVSVGTVGVARDYYVRWVGGERRLGFDPGLSDAATVTHWSTQAWVAVTEGASVSDSAVPVWPRTHREVLLAAARVIAYEDVDNYDAMAQQEAKYQRKLSEARDQLLTEQWDEPEYMRVSGPMF